MEISTFLKQKFIPEATLLFAVIILFSHCQTTSPQRDISAFYYTAATGIDHGLVYEYRVAGNDTIPPYYWHYQTEKDKDITFLVGQYLDETLTPRQFAKEKITKSGALMQDYFFVGRTAQGAMLRVPVTVLDANVFPFQIIGTTDAFLFRAQYSETGDSSNITMLTRLRRWVGDTTIVWKGQQLPCIRFEVTESLDNQQEGHFEQQFSGEEWYAKGIGLVRYSKEITPKIFLQYVLHDVYPIEQLNQTINK